MTTEKTRRIELAPAKINLTLHVTGQNAKGWHLLDSLAVFAELGDRLWLLPDGQRLPEGEHLAVSGPRAAGVPLGADNLIAKAVALAGVTPAPALHLEKNLPAASGMGGGTSDAAATLRLLGARLSVEAMMTLGADLPLCMAAPSPSRMRGLGERVEPVATVPGLWLLLANPGIELATPAVFKALASKDNPAMPEELPRWQGLDDFVAWLKAQRNDLEAPAITLAPQIGALLDALRQQNGCRLARMTGSGATCFGIFESRAARDQAAKRLAENASDLWIGCTQTAHRAPDQ